MKNTIKHVLSYYGLQAHADRFVSTPDGLALAAHLCNAGAKFFDPALYDYKSDLIRAAADVHPFCWHRDGIIYFETCVGQVSFHIFDGEEDGIADRDEDIGPWAGGWMQDIAFEMALAFLGLQTPHDESLFERWIRFFQG